jgi:GDP-L-fucose synthase
MELKGKVVGICGGSGFLGKQIVKKLEERGAIVLAPRSSQYDFRKEGDAEKFFSENKMDAFIHSGAIYGGLGINERMPAEIYDINMRMALNAFKASIDAETGTPRVEKMVAIGSACGYPGALGTNMKEELMWNGPIDKSVRNYGTIKKLMETIGHVYRDQYGLNVINLQLATLYGENDTYNPERSHVPAALMRKFVEAKESNLSSVELWGVPDTVREFMYVKDCAEGIIRSLENFDGDLESNDQSKYTLNIGTGSAVTIDELAKTIKELVGYGGGLTYNGESPGQKEKALEVSRMRRVLNWQPPTSLKGGLKQTLDWYIPNKESADSRN